MKCLERKFSQCILPLRFDNILGQTEVVAEFFTRVIIGASCFLFVVPRVLEEHLRYFQNSVSDF